MHTYTSPDTNHPGAGDRETFISRYRPTCPPRLSIPFTEPQNLNVCRSASYMYRMHLYARRRHIVQCE